VIGPRARPDFFIVGAAKSGTTALYEYLRGHRQIFMADTKELNYFGSDLVRRGTQRLDQDAYLAYFAAASPGQRIGEASVRYLRSRLAAAEIAAFSPGAQAIVMLREPVDMLQSLHAELVFRGEEEIADFAEALEAETDRRSGRRIPAAASLPDLLFYRGAVRYAEQVERFYAALGRDRVHVIIYDDFSADPRAAYLSTLHFLGVDPGPEPDFAVVNPAKEARSQRLALAISNPPAWARTMVRSIIPRPMRKRIFKGALRLNARPVVRQALDRELVLRLQAEFAPEVRRLQTLIGRELPEWTAP
jgi:hypothetical protein